MTASRPYFEAARELHDRYPVIDLHADTPALMRFGYDLGARHEPALPGGALGYNVDIPRMIDGGLTAQCFGLVSVPAKRFPFHRGPRRAVDRLIDALELAASRLANQFVLARTAAEVRRAHAQGLRVGLCGIEGAHPFEQDIANVTHFCARGVLYVGLVHLSANSLAAPAYGVGTDETRGLSQFGYDFVASLNAHKMIVDLAHLNVKGFYDVLQWVKGPVMVTHSAASGVYSHPRNLTDEQLRAVAAVGGCVGIIFARQYLGSGELDAVCDHLEHMIEIGGEDLPALGSDFDGLITPTRQLADVSQLPNLTEAMLTRGYSRQTMSKILSGNALRVIEHVRG